MASRIRNQAHRNSFRANLCSHERTYDRSALDLASRQPVPRFRGFPTLPPYPLINRTYALDSIYDFGLSVSRGKIQNLEDIVTWLHEVLAVLVPEGSVRLIGLSYGGWAASQYVLRFPERVRKVVLLAPALTVLPVSFALIFRMLLSPIPIPGFRKQFYYIAFAITKPRRVQG